MQGLFRGRNPSGPDDGIQRWTVYICPNGHEVAEGWSSYYRARKIHYFRRGVTLCGIVAHPRIRVKSANECASAEGLIMPRKHWWEANDAAKLYVEQGVAKWKQFGWQTRISLTTLPRGFTCWHFDKETPIEDRLRIVLPSAMSRPRGDWEYALLEMERVYWNSIRRALRWSRSG